MPRSLLTKPIIFLTAIFVVLVGYSLYKTSYNECILEKVKPGMSNLAASVVMDACENMSTVSLPSDALEKLRGYLWFDADKHQWTATGNIYNGNSDWTVTELTFVLYKPYKPNDEPTDTTPDRSIKVNIPPLAETAVSFEFRRSFLDSADKKIPYTWYIPDAKGYQE